MGKQYFFLFDCTLSVVSEPPGGFSMPSFFTHNNNIQRDISDSGSNNVNTKMVGFHGNSKIVNSIQRKKEGKK